VQHFSRAFALDSTNFFPLLEETLAHLSLGQYAQADSLVAFVSASRNRLDVGSGLFLDLLAASVRGDRPRAAEVSRRALERSRGVVWEFQAGYQALSAARPREAIKMMNGLDPDRGFLKGVWAYRGVMAEAYHVLGDHESELDLARAQRKIDSQLLSSLLYEVRALAALGRIDEVRNRISESEGLPPQSGLIPSLPPLRGLSPGLVMTEAALELRAHGQPNASRQIVNRAIVWYASHLRQAPQQESLRRGLAAVHYLAGDWQASMTMWAALSEENPTDVDYLGYVGVSAARLGRRIDATSVDRRLRDWNRPYTFGRNTLWRARIAAQLGERQRAVDLVRQAFAEGHVFDSELHCDVDLETLRGFKGFEEILNPTA
jgi:tetratricopeptide (TPR) repeat protein